MNRKQLKIIDMLCLDETPDSLKLRLRNALQGDPNGINNVDILIQRRLQNKKQNKKLLNHKNWVMIDKGWPVNKTEVHVHLEYRQYPGILIEALGVCHPEGNRIRFRISVLIRNNLKSERKRRTYSTSLVRSYLLDF